MLRFKCGERAFCVSGAKIRSFMRKCYILSEEGDIVMYLIDGGLLLL
jgi:hypothetical protein